MLSNKQEKLIRSLHRKKFRKTEGLFLIEGIKLLEELLKSSLKHRGVFATEEHSDACAKLGIKDIQLIDEKEINSISAMTTPPGILAMVEIPKENFISSSVILYLDGISDPGNMGTIIRTAEGLGVQQILLSRNCVDIYSPKVVQSSMGSLFRMSFYKEDFSNTWEKLSPTYQFYAADMSGNSIYESELKSPAVIVLGSESHGLSNETNKEVLKYLSIPISENLESYNVAIANAILLSEFKRKNLL